MTVSAAVQDWLRSPSRRAFKASVERRQSGRRPDEPALRLVVSDVGAKPWVLRRDPNADDQPRALLRQVHPEPRIDGGAARPSTLDSDADLVVRAQEGDQRACSLLVSRHKVWLRRFILRHVGDAEDACDVLQDSFAAALTRLELYDPTWPFPSWLRGIAINKCRDRARRAFVRRPIKASPRDRGEIEQVADAVPTFDDVIVARQALDVLNRSIAALPVSLREPLVLTALQGLSQTAAGERLDLSAKAVEVRVYRAKRALVKSLDASILEDIVWR